MIFCCPSGQHAIPSDIYYKQIFYFSLLTPTNSVLSGALSSLCFRNKHTFNFLFISLLQDENKKHPGHDMMYEHHSNQSGDPDNVLVHALGHWRLTQLFHDLAFHPKVVVSIGRDFSSIKTKKVNITCLTQTNYANNHMPLILL